MVRVKALRQGQSVAVKRRKCVLVATMAALVMASVQAETAPQAELADVMNLAIAMRVRDVVSAGLPSSARNAYPELTDSQLTCIGAASVSHIVGSYAVAIRKALTKEEVTSAQQFYTSAEGEAYVSKQSSAQPAALTSTESAAFNAFLATSAGQKLVTSKSYVTAELNSELAGHLASIVNGCQPT